MVSIKEKLLSGKNYLYAEYSFRLPNGKIKKISKLIKSKEKAQTKEIKEYFLKKEVEAYQQFAIKYYNQDDVLTKQKIEKIEEFKVEYKQIIKSLSKKQFQDILDRFTVNFTYESNALEGNSLTLKDVTLLLAENIVPKGKDLREIYETKNTRIANEMLFKKEFKIGIKDIVKLHSILVKDTGISIGFKKLPNYLLLRKVKTIPPEKVEEEMNKIVQWYQENKQTEHPLRLASEFHGRFEKIHPFEDGNGRVGRMLINIILLENDYPPIIIRKTMRESYFNALEAYDQRSKQKLLRFVMEKLENTFNHFFKIYIKYI